MAGAPATDDDASQRPASPALGERLSALGIELWAMARALAEEQLVGERQRLEAEQEGLRTQMAEAVQLADRLTEEAEGLRARLADYQALQADHEALKARLTKRSDGARRS